MIRIMLAERHIYPSQVRGIFRGMLGEVFGMLADGQVVSTCESSREDKYAGEAWVRTLEPYRRRGYARQVTAAWGRWLQQHGRVPFYSHRAENLASRAVAQSLGLIEYIEDAGYA